MVGNLNLKPVPNIFCADTFAPFKTRSAISPNNNRSANFGMGGNKIGLPSALAIARVKSRLEIGAGATPLKTPLRFEFEMANE